MSIGGFSPLNSSSPASPFNPNPLNLPQPPMPSGQQMNPFNMNPLNLGHPHPQMGGFWNSADPANLMGHSGSNMFANAFNPLGSNMTPGVMPNNMQGWGPGMPTRNALMQNLFMPRNNGGFR